MSDVTDETNTPVHCLHGQSKRPECILCGRCLSVCPLFAATGREELSPRAKFFLARAVAEGRADLTARAAEILATVCLSCGKCESACPLGLCGPDLVAELRAAHPGFAGFLWKLWIERAGIMWPLARSLAKLLPGNVPIDAVSRAKDALDALGCGRAPEPWLFPETFDQRNAGRKAVLFAGCVLGHAAGEQHGLASGVSLVEGLGEKPRFGRLAAAQGVEGVLGPADRVDGHIAGQQLGQRAGQGPHEPGAFDPQLPQESGEARMGGPQFGH